MNSIDYGPLTALIGAWEGSKGTDVAPSPSGTDVSTIFNETLVFTPVGDVQNAREQTLVALHYHHCVQRQQDGIDFHNETGYWMWDAATQTIMQSLTIPRGVSLLAGGSCQRTDTVIEVTAALGDQQWGIVQSPFMSDKAKTTAFSHKIVVENNQLIYSETTTLDIYGKTFSHTDEGTLERQQ